ncbi:sensor histidine kinase [Scytonema sp. UIC 10036]|uniref:sensor histidine kinase n=1 Tax=Scytonema sp. UIC 10036 TaxID=2304196 RepID=UPI0012DAC813|nr:ATP-binding protein [Scytonema sp. UIC 10036]MUG92232.1 sensor histidine kinase [Scytonema sp. UIC 10036]
MFREIRYRLLLSYMGVFALILGCFALAVRVVFTRSLNQEFTEKLIDLGEGAAANARFENGHVKIENEFPILNIIARKQALQWFDPQGHLIDQQGDDVLNLPIVEHKTINIQTDKKNIQAVTLPIIGSDDGKLIGYVRASQSLNDFYATLHKLDWGLSGGILIAMVLSGVGGILLTRQAMQPIEDSFQRLKQFTADASHELRSPLMAIKSNATVALKYPEGMREADVDKFQAIVSATQQMSSLTEDLLFLARTDKIPNQKRELVNLAEILENLVLQYKPEAETKQIHLQCAIGNHLYLLGDGIQLMRLFTNLVANALHYTPNGGKIEIRANLTGSHILVKVQDTGVGIAPENLEKIFERFWRADSSRSYHSGGSGLGLSIVRAIVENHGGSIAVTSQLGVGSCFTVRLPASGVYTNLI